MSQSGVVADFGRSCLPGRTSLLAATSVHVIRQDRFAVSLARRSRFACGLPLNMIGYGLSSHWQKKTMSRENAVKRRRGS
jgi:hypothetical protein